MSWSLEGVRGARWRAPAWIGRGVVRVLVPHLRANAEVEIANELLAVQTSGVTDASLRDRLDDPRASERFLRALRAAIADAEADDPRSWRDPAARPHFVAALRDLERLAGRDGNAHVLEILARTP